MDRASADEAARAAGTPCKADPATMARVIAGLRKDMPAVDVLSRHDHLALPAETLERRTYAILRGVR
jgi:hypothetical protein